MTEVGVWSFQEFQGKDRLGRRRKEKGLKRRTDIGLHPTSVYGQKIESTSLWSVCKAGRPIAGAYIMPPEAYPTDTESRLTNPPT